MSAQADESQFLDPFWLMFAESESDEDTPPKKETKKKRRKQLSEEPTREVKSDKSGLFDYFSSRERGTIDKETREPSQSRFGRQSRSEGRWLFQQKQSSSETRDMPANGSERWTSRKLDGLKRRSRPSDEGSSMHDDEESLVTNQFPSFLETLANTLDPWQDEAASSGASIESEYSDDVTVNDESTATGTSYNESTTNDNTEEVRDLKEVLLKFDPIIEEPREDDSSFSSCLGPIPPVIRRRTTAAPKPNLEDGYSNPLVERRESRGGFTASTSSSSKGASTSSSSKGESRKEIVQSKSTVNRPQNAIRKLSCCVVGGQSDLANGQMFTIDELSGEQMVRVFPKVRMVADEQQDNQKPSTLVASSNQFIGSVPAHLQLSPGAYLQMKGPQSLYEYEYEGGQHADIVYHHFGCDPKTLLDVRYHISPPSIKNADDQAVIQIEASTVSMTDCSMRLGEWWGKETPPLPIVPGVDFVGKIYRIGHEVSSRYNLYVGDRVMSLTKCGGNARYMSIHPKLLVKVTEDVDPAEAACLPETYLSAFQVVHFGQTASTRYRENSLRGKSILMLGSVTTNLGNAIFEIAQDAGVEKFFVTSTPRRFAQLRSKGILPVNVDPSLWFDQLDGEIDLVLATDGEGSEAVTPDHFRVLGERGHLVVVGQNMSHGMPIGEWQSEDNMHPKHLMCTMSKSKTKLMDRSHDYDPFRQWEHDSKRCKQDLAYLVSLLHKRAIKPKVLDRIPMSKVAKAQEMVQNKQHIGGFLVCEPWLRLKRRTVCL